MLNSSENRTLMNADERRYFHSSWCAAPMFNSFQNRSLINADGADKNKNQRNQRHPRPFSFMIGRRGACGLLCRGRGFGDQVIFFIP
jgi:hypothetical protein